MIGSFASNIKQKFVCLKRVEHVLGDIPEVYSSTACACCVEMLQKQASHIRELWLGIQRSYPEVYQAIQTKHAAQHIIHHETSNLHLLMEHGLLEETEFQKMTMLLLEAEHALKLKSFMSSVEDNPKQIILNLPFVSKIRSKEMINVILNGAIKNYVEKNEKIAEKGTNAQGILIIARGTAALTTDGNTLDHYTAGSLLAWEWMASAQYRGDLVVCVCLSLCLSL